MFIVKFQGALGNQMFEYSFFKKLEKIYGNNLVLGYVPSITDFNGYELERVFPNINIRKASPLFTASLSNDYPDTAPLSKIMKLFFKIKLVTRGPKFSHIKEDDNTCYYKEVYELNPLYSYLLDGVWANSAYLEGIESEIKNTFVFSDGLSEKNLEYKEKILNSNSICLHVRRNEYVSMGLSVASDDYYRKAVNYMLEHVSSPKFFVFSDDHNYCKELFDGMIDYTMIEGNTKENSFRDMELMSYCKHNVIANSTFSFWGAFLNKNEDKIVINPNIAWGDLKCPYSCKNWITMKVNA